MRSHRSTRSDMVALPVAIAAIAAWSVQAAQHRIPLTFAPADYTNLAEPQAAALSFHVRLLAVPEGTAAPAIAKGLSDLRTAALTFGNSERRLFAGLDDRAHYQVAVPSADGWSLLDGSKPGAQQFVQWTVRLQGQASEPTVDRLVRAKVGGGTPPQWIEVKVSGMATGQLDTGGNPMKVGLLSSQKDLRFDEPKSVQLLLDLDRDGLFENRRHSGTEVYRLDQAYEMLDKCMVFAADPIGTHLLVADSPKEGIAIGPLTVGHEIPDLQAKRLDGSPWRLSTCRGSPTVLYFFDPNDRHFASRSKGLKMQLDQVDQAGRDAGLRIIGISLASTADETEAFVKAHDLPGEILIGGAGWESPCVVTMHLRYLGTAYYVDKSGVLWPSTFGRYAGPEQFKAFLDSDATESKATLAGAQARARMTSEVQRLYAAGRLAEAQELVREFVAKHPRLAEGSALRWTKQTIEAEFETPRVVGTVE